MMYEDHSFAAIKRQGSAFVKIRLVRIENWGVVYEMENESSEQCYVPWTAIEMLKVYKEGWA